MKKNIFMISAAMLALVSCTKDEVIQINNGQKINFHTALNTRATELTTSNLLSFQATALYNTVGEDSKDHCGNTYFNATFSRTSAEDTYFTSTTDYYWPANEKLHIFAYYPYGEIVSGGTVTINNEKQVIEGFTPATKISEQVDFIAEYVIADKAHADYAGGSVQLSFEHKLSQIEVKAKNANSGYNVWVKAIRIKNVAGSGDFDFSAATNNWSNWGDLTNYEICFKKEETIEVVGEDGGTSEKTIEVDVPLTLTEKAQSLMWNKGNAMLIPQSTTAWGVQVNDPVEVGTNSGNNEGENGEPSATREGGTGGVGNGTDGTETKPEETDPNGSYIALLVKIETETGSPIFPLNDKDGFGWVAAPMAFNWQPGFKYIYEIDFTEGAGVVAPDQEEDENGWEDDDSGEGGTGGGGDDDDDNPGEGDSVFGKSINVSVSFGGWTTTYSQTIKE